MIRCAVPCTNLHGLFYPISAHGCIAFAPSYIPSSRLQPDGYKMQRTDSEPGSSPGRPDGDQEGRQCDTPCREEGEEGEGEVEGEGGGGGTEGRESEGMLYFDCAAVSGYSLLLQSC